MQQKVELNKVRNTQEVIDQSILFVKQNFKPLLKAYYFICGFFLIVGIVLSGFFQIYFGEVFTTGTRGGGSSFYLIAFVEMLSFLFICLTSMSFLALYIAKDNEAPNVDEVWSYVKFYFFRMLASSTVLFIGLSLATVFFVIPGIYLWPIFCLVPVIMILDNTSLSYAFSHAFKLLKNNWGNLFGVLMITFFLMLAAGILLITPVMIVSTILVFLIGKSELHIAMLAFNIALHLVQILGMFPFIVISFYYFSIIEQQENGSLLSRIESLGVKKTNNLLTAEEGEEY